jgi:hypothetical protein
VIETHSFLYSCCHTLQVFEIDLFWKMFGKKKGMQLERCLGYYANRNFIRYVRPGELVLLR